mgnify:CR=1 FL=1
MKQNNSINAKLIFLLFIVTSSFNANASTRAEAKVLILSSSVREDSVVSLTDDVNVSQTGYVNASYDATHGIVIPASAGTYTVGFGSYIPESYTGPGTMYLHRVQITNQDGISILDESFDGWSQESTSTTDSITRSIYSTNTPISWSTYADTSNFYNGGGTAFQAIDYSGDSGMVYPLDGGGPFSVLIRTLITVPENTTAIRVKVDWRYNVTLYSGSARVFSVGLQPGSVEPENLFSFSEPTNNLPSISGTPPATVDEDVPYSFTPSVSDLDADDTHTFSITNKPSWAAFSATTGALTGTPSNDDVGVTAGIVITATDSAGAGASLTAFSVTVSNTNDAPVITGTPTITVAQDEAYRFTPSVTDVDAGDTQTFSLPLILL